MTDLDRTRPADEIAASELMAGKWVSLAYLVFVFLPLAFAPRWPAQAVVASVVAIAVFLPVHLAFYRWRGRRQQALVLAAAAIGFALIPFNPGGNTFVIYAVAMAATVLPPRLAIGLSALLLALMALEFWWVMPTGALALAYTSMVLVISTSAVAGILLHRARLRRDAELRLTREEFGRLAALAERERIGRDLHDLLGHTLSLVALKSDLASRLIGHDPAAARKEMDDVSGVAREALAQVRRAVSGIRAAGLAAELASARLLLESDGVRFSYDIGEVALSPEQETVLALAVREAVTNIQRHARAEGASVSLHSADRQVSLRIDDDGRGGAIVPGNGLCGMRERIEALGGKLRVDAMPGQGTRVEIVLPLPAPGAIEFAAAVARLR